MMALSSMTNGETWTPICIPGCTEDYMLHVYISFRAVNLGIVLVCTDHQCFEECHEFSNKVFEFIGENRSYAGESKANIYEVVNRCTFQMYQEVDMKEVILLFVRNNESEQYSSYNYPLLTRVTFQHEKHLRVFESMLARHEAQIQQTRREMRLSSDADAIKHLRQMRRGGPDYLKKRKKGKIVEVLAKQVHLEYSYAMISCQSYERQAIKTDFTLFLVYDHR